LLSTTVSIRIKKIPPKQGSGDFPRKPDGFIYRGQTAKALFCGEMTIRIVSH
jgi:hypothetical protein